MKLSLLGAPLLSVFLLAACGKSSPASSKDGGIGGLDGGALSSCLERPGEPPRAPSGQLPCEMIPPSLR